MDLEKIICDFCQKEMKEEDQIQLSSNVVICEKCFEKESVTCPVCNMTCTGRLLCSCNSNCPE